MGVRGILRSFPVAAGALLVAACSTVLGIDEDYRLTESGGAAGQSGTGGSGGMGGVGPELPPPGLCDEYANAMCGYRDYCCKGLYPVVWNESWSGQCVATLRDQCQAGVASVPAQRVYHPDMWTACKSVLGAGKADCALTFPEFFDAVAALSPCIKVITGQAPAGAPCKATADCAFVPDPGKALICSAGSCVLRGKLSVGEPCSPGPACGPGLYCLVPPAQQVGHCETATKAGAPCSSEPECGPGSRCEQGTSVCTPGLPPGSACTQSAECGSTFCVKNVCAEVPLFSPGGCQGAELL